MESEKLDAASKSIKVNVVLAIVKLVTGIFTGSLGIIAEFLHSLFDLMASFLAYFGIKKASQPADRTHPYGHGRVENVSSLLQAALISVTSIVIIYSAYLKVEAGEFGVKESLLGIAVMIITILVDIKISRYLHKKSDKTGSPALKADAYHFSTDMWSTGAVIIGLGAAHFGFPIADVVAACFVAILMLSLSVKLGIRATKVMLDQVPDASSIEKITTIIAKYPGIRGYHSLRAREAGSHIFVDVSIHVDKSLSIEKAHELADRLELKVKKKCSAVKEVVVHLEPEDFHDSGNIARRMKER